MRHEPGVISLESRNEWDKIFAELISLIGENSKGGNSVADVAQERER